MGHLTVTAPSLGYQNYPCYSNSTPKQSYMVRVTDTINAGAIALTDVSDIFRCSMAAVCWQESSASTPPII